MEKADFPELCDKIRSGTDDMVGKVKGCKAIQASRERAKI